MNRTRIFFVNSCRRYRFRVGADVPLKFPCRDLSFKHFMNLFQCSVTGLRYKQPDEDEHYHVGSEPNVPIILDSQPDTKIQECLSIYKADLYLDGFTYPYFALHPKLAGFMK